VTTLRDPPLGPPEGPWSARACSPSSEELGSRRLSHHGLPGVPVQEERSEPGAPKSPETSDRTCGGAHWPVSEPLFPGVSFPYDVSGRGQRLVPELPPPAMLRLQVFSTS
jgi:hypothetical protein